MLEGNKSVWLVLVCWSLSSSFSSLSCHAFLGSSSTSSTASESSTILFSAIEKPPSSPSSFDDTESDNDENKDNNNDTARILGLSQSVAKTKAAMSMAAFSVTSAANSVSDNEALLEKIQQTVASDSSPVARDIFRVLKETKRNTNILLSLNETTTTTTPPPGIASAPTANDALLNQISQSVCYRQSQQYLPQSSVWKPQRRAKTRPPPTDPKTIYQQQYFSSRVNQSRQRALLYTIQHARQDGIKTATTGALDPARRVPNAPTERGVPPTLTRVAPTDRVATPSRRSASPSPPSKQQEYFANRIADTRRRALLANIQASQGNTIAKGGRGFRRSMPVAGSASSRQRQYFANRIAQSRQRALLASIQNRNVEATGLGQQSPPSTLQREYFTQRIAASRNEVAERVRARHNSIQPENVESYVKAEPAIADESKNTIDSSASKNQPLEVPETKTILSMQSSTNFSVSKPSTRRDSIQNTEPPRFVSQATTKSLPAPPSSCPKAYSTPTLPVDVRTKLKSTSEVPSAKTFNVTNKATVLAPPSTRKQAATENTTDMARIAKIYAVAVSNDTPVTKAESTNIKNDDLPAQKVTQTKNPSPSSWSAPSPSSWSVTSPPATLSKGNTTLIGSAVHASGTKLSWMNSTSPKAITSTSKANKVPFPSIPSLHPSKVQPSHFLPTKPKTAPFAKTKEHSNNATDTFKRHWLMNANITTDSDPQALSKSPFSSNGSLSPSRAPLFSSSWSKARDSPVNSTQSTLPSFQPKKTLLNSSTGMVETKAPWSPSKQEQKTPSSWMPAKPPRTDRTKMALLNGSLNTTAGAATNTDKATPSAPWAPNNLSSWTPSEPFPSKNSANVTLGTGTTTPPSSWSPDRDKLKDSAWAPSESNKDQESPIEHRSTVSNETAVRTALSDKLNAKWASKIPSSVTTSPSGNIEKTKASWILSNSSKPIESVKKTFSHVLKLAVNTENATSTAGAQQRNTLSLGTKLGTRAPISHASLGNKAATSPRNFKKPGSKAPFPPNTLEKKPSWAPATSAGGKSVGIPFANGSSTTSIEKVSKKSLWQSQKKIKPADNSDSKDSSGCLNKVVAEENAPWSQQDEEKAAAKLTKNLSKKSPWEVPKEDQKASSVPEKNVKSTTLRGTIPLFGEVLKPKHNGGVQRRPTSDAATPMVDGMGREAPGKNITIGGIPIPEGKTVDEMEAFYSQYQKLIDEETKSSVLGKPANGENAQLAKSVNKVEADASKLSVAPTIPPSWSSPSKVNRYISWVTKENKSSSSDNTASQLSSTRRKKNESSGIVKVVLVMMGITALPTVILPFLEDGSLMANVMSATATIEKFLVSEPEKNIPEFSTTSGELSESKTVVMDTGTQPKQVNEVTSPKAVSNENEDIFASPSSTKKTIEQIDPLQNTDEANGGTKVVPDQTAATIQSDSTTEALSTISPSSTNKAVEQTDSLQETGEEKVETKVVPGLKPTNTQSDSISGEPSAVSPPSTNNAETEPMQKIEAKEKTNGVPELKTTASQSDSLTEAPRAVSPPKVDSKQAPSTGSKASIDEQRKEGTTKGLSTTSEIEPVTTATTTDAVTTQDQSKSAALQKIDAPKEDDSKETLTSSGYKIPPVFNIAPAFTEESVTVPTAEKGTKSDTDVSKEVKPGTVLTKSTQGDPNTSRTSRVGTNHADGAKLVLTTEKPPVGSPEADVESKNGNNGEEKESNVEHDKSLDMLTAAFKPEAVAKTEAETASETTTTAKSNTVGEDENGATDLDSTNSKAIEVTKESTDSEKKELVESTVEKEEPTNMIQGLFKPNTKIAGANNEKIAVETEAMLESADKKTEPTEFKQEKDDPLNMIKSLFQLKDATEVDSKALKDGTVDAENSMNIHTAPLAGQDATITEETGDLEPEICNPDTGTVHKVIEDFRAKVEGLTAILKNNPPPADAGKTPEQAKITTKDLDFPGSARQGESVRQVSGVKSTTVDSWTKLDRPTTDSDENKSVKQNIKETKTSVQTIVEPERPAVVEPAPNVERAVEKLIVVEPDTKDRAIKAESIFRFLQQKQINSGTKISPESIQQSVKIIFGEIFTKDAESFKESKIKQEADKDAASDKVKASSTVTDVLSKASESKVAQASFAAAAAAKASQLLKSKEEKIREPPLPAWEFDRSSTESSEAEKQYLRTLLGEYAEQNPISQFDLETQEAEEISWLDTVMDRINKAHNSDE